MDPTYYNNNLLTAILVTGGFGVSETSEVLLTNGSALCRIPNMPQNNGKMDHTQSGLTACGGLGID